MIWLCNILICMQKHSQHNNEERTQFFRKIYLSLYSKWYERVTKGLCVNREPWGPSSQSGAGSHAGILSPKLWLQLTQTSCRTGLYHCLTYTCFLWASHLHRIQPVHSQGYPWYIRPDAPVIYTGAFLIWQLGRVGGQYVTTVRKISEETTTYKINEHVFLASEQKIIVDRLTCHSNKAMCLIFWTLR